VKACSSAVILVSLLISGRVQTGISLSCPSVRELFMKSSAA